MYAGRAFRHGRLGAQDCGQLFIVDAYQVECVACDFFRDGCHGSDLLTGKNHPAFCQYAAFLVVHAPHGFWRVRTGQDGLDAGQGKRRGHIDIDNARMRVGAAQDLAMQHSRHLDVTGILGAAKNLCTRRDLRHRGAQCG